MGYFPLLIISFIIYISHRTDGRNFHHLYILCMNSPSLPNDPGKVSNEDPEAFNKPDSLVTHE